MGEVHEGGDRERETKCGEEGKEREERGNTVGMREVTRDTEE